MPELAFYLVILERAQKLIPPFLDGNQWEPDDLGVFYQIGRAHV